VLPEQDAVLAITAGLDNMQPPLDLAWEHLLPAMGSAPLPEDQNAQAALGKKLSRLQLRTQAGEKTSPSAARFSGKSFRIEPNMGGVSEIRFRFGEGDARVTFCNDSGEQPVACGYGSWSRSLVRLYPADAISRSLASQSTDPWKAAASGAWLDDATLAVKLWWYETPFACTFLFHFDGEQLAVEQRTNVGFGPVEGPELHGSMLY
jgi:hypothetical protein